MAVRIIAGKWRSRKIAWPDSLPIRPTQNMVRETLFNWLGKDIVGANCLDLFTGSGALGFEALSRGAAHVVMVDHAKKVLDALKKNIKILEISPLSVTLVFAHIPQQFDLIPSHERFSVVFLDPPFHQGLIPSTIAKLSTSNLLTPNALIYVEAEKRFDINECLPMGWQVLRHKKQGQATYYLLMK